MPVEELDYDEPMTAKAEKKVVLQTYKVRKGDTLQKISQKFYGTTKKWSALFEANKDRLKSPDKVYPGQLLNIPAVAGYRK
ncbi:MAG: LysM peptidoglycan-binding domain-containing protein [Candidatus Omnitrophica bacterium]|nr:LysM peptidoglycan-binding domain-containing protein [Candidatus Omnitrophota bacterium]